MDFPMDIEVCDPHYHTWDRTVFYNKNLGDIVDGDLGIYTGERFAKESASINLVSAVHVETVVGQKPGGFAIDTVAETKYTVEQAKALAPRPIGIVAYVNLAREDFAAVLDAHAAAAAGAANSAIVGVRQIMNFRSSGQLTWPQVEHGDYFDGTSAASLAFACGLKELSSRGLTFDLHCNWEQIEAAAAFLKAHAPADLRVILNHVGCPKLEGGVGEDSDESRLAVWRAGMSALSALPNVHVKLSGLEYVYNGWMVRSSPQNKDACALVRTILGLFGASRCMFASNYPVDKFMAPPSPSPSPSPTGTPTMATMATIGDLYTAMWGLCEDLQLSREDRVALFKGTATGVYRLDAIMMQGGRVGGDTAAS